MPEFIYNGKTVSYHSFCDSGERWIIPLGKPKGEKLALYEFASKFGSPDLRGFSFSVLWMLYGDEPDGDKAYETLRMMESEGCEKSTFVVFDSEGAGIIRELYGLRPECIEKVFADEDTKDVLEALIKDMTGFPEVGYCTAQDPQNLFAAVSNSFFGRKMECPYCGSDMQMGYIYGPQTGETFWTTNPDLIKTAYGESEAVIPMRDTFRDYDSLRELFSGISPEVVPRGFLCRKCGKMVVDMSPALIHFKDRIYFEANGLPEDYAVHYEDEEEKEDAFSAVGDSLRRVFARKKGDSNADDNAKQMRQREKELEKKYGSGEDRPRKHGLFGRGPKVE